MRAARLRLTRMIFAHQPDLAPIHPEARSLALDTLTARLPAAFHLDAQRSRQEAHR